jgi:hypothetical protein
MKTGKKKDDTFNYFNFSFVLLVAFGAAYSCFWDYFSLDTHSHAPDALYWSMGFVFILAIMIIGYYRIVIRN